MRHSRTIVRYAAGLLMICGACPGAWAASATWTDNGADNNWTTPDNWSASPVPGPDDTATFGDTASNVAQTVNLSVNQVVRSITFAAADNEAYTIVSNNGSTLTLSVTTGGTVTMSTALDVMFNVPVILNAATIVSGAGAGSVFFNDGISGGGSFNVNNARVVLTAPTSFTGTLFMNGAGEIVVANSGALVGSGTGNGLTVSTGNPTLSLAADARLGAATLNGSLNVRLTDQSNPDPAADRTLTLGGTVTANANVSAINIVANDGAATGDVTVRVLNTLAGNLSVNKPINTIAGSTVLIETTNAGGTITFTDTVNASPNDGLVAGAGRLRKIGPGSLILQTPQTYTGGTVLEGGTISYTTASAASMPDTGTIAISAGATLNLNNLSDTVGGISGKGIINLGNTAGNTLTITEGVSPGLGSAEDIATLTVTNLGNVVLGPASNSVFELNRILNANDLVAMTGGANANLTLGGTLTIISATGIKNVGSTYTLFDLSGGSVSGEFTDFNFPYWMKGFVSVINGDVVLTVTAVPEPASAALLSLGLCLLRRRTRQVKR